MSDVRNVTDDGVPIREGLRVFGYDYKWGTVGKEHRHTPGWWDVHLDDGGRPMYDGSRMTTRPPRGCPPDPKAGQ